jgi:hypothetical protein
MRQPGTYPHAPASLPLQPVLIQRLCACQGPGWLGQVPIPTTF